MKTSWSTDYLNSRMSGREQGDWCSQKRKEFKAKTGVAWSSFHAHGKVFFNPVLKMRDVEEIRDAARTAIFIAAYKAVHGPFRYAGFRQIYETSGLAYPEVMGIACALVRDEQATCSVDRMGMANCIKVY